MKTGGIVLIVAMLTGLAVPAAAEVRFHFGYNPYVPGYYPYYPDPFFRPMPRYRYRHYRLPGYSARRYAPDDGGPVYRPEPEIKSQAKPPAPKAKPKPVVISCAKASRIITGYGFSAVKSINCKGQIYSFNAVRDGKNFTVKLSAKDGELTEVKKL